MASVHSALPTLAVVIVLDSSITLASEWPLIIHDYFPQLFRRLAGENNSSFAHLRLGFITYGPQDCDGSPVFLNRFFALGALNELKDDPSKLAMGRTVTGGSLGMAALEGYAAAIEMFDILRSGVNQKPLRPLNMNESRDKHKEEFSCHLWHFAAGQPDDAKHPLWNSLSTLDTLTWTTVPAELKKRDINCSMLLVCPSPKFSELFSAIADTRLQPWFRTREHHTVLLSGFAPSPKPKAALPSTVPAKRPAETPAEQRSPGPKIARPPSQTASPALAAAKKPIPQSSSLAPPATAVAPPPSLLSSPSLHSSPPKPPPREPPEPGIIDLTQPTPELAPAAVHNRAQPPKPNQPPVLPNPAQTPQPIQQPIQPPTQSQAPTTPQSQLQPSMQPQLQPPSQSPSVGVGVRQLASADVGEMRAKLQQVEMRIRETQKRYTEATSAGNAEEANKQRSILGRQVAAYKKGHEFVEKVEVAKKLVTAGQAQGSSQPPDSALNPITSQHPTPTASATPQATPPMNPHSTPRLATPRKPGIPVNQNPLSGRNASPPNINPNSAVIVGPGPPANTNTNAALLQAFNPTAAQTPPQVSLGGVSTPDAHLRGATPQHRHAHTNSFGTQPPQLPPTVVAAQMKQFAEQRGPTQGSQGLIVGGNSSGSNAGAGPQTAGGLGERNKQWSGTLTWQGTDTARNERKEVRAQVTAIATKGDPMASTWPKVLSLAPAGPAVSMDELHEWMRKHNPVVMHIQPTPGADEHGYGQLVKLLRDKGCYAIANWEIPGNGRLTANLLIAPLSQGLLGAAFPATGIPEIPKPRLQLDAAMRQNIFNMLPPHIRNLPEPQLSQAIMQIYIRRVKPMQGGGLPLPNAATLPLQQQQQQQQRQQPPPPQHHQQQSVDHFLQNPGVNIPSTGSMFGNMGPKQGELNPFVPGSQANVITSGLLAQPTASQQLQQRQHQQQVHTQQQQQQQAQQQNQQRAMIEMHRALSGGLGAGVAGGLGGGLMNTSGANSALGLSAGSLNPLGMSGNMGPAGIAPASNGLPVGGFRNNGGGIGMGVAVPVSGAGFGGLGSGTGLDGAGAPVGAGEGAGVGMAGMLHGAAGGVTLGMYQSFMQRNGEGGQGQ